jgi:hypothetical protein
MMLFDKIHFCIFACRGGSDGVAQVRLAEKTYWLQQQTQKCRVYKRKLQIYCSNGERDVVIIFVVL